MPTENKNGAGADDTTKKDLENAGADAGAKEGAAAGGADDDKEVTLKQSEVDRLKKLETDNDNYQKALGIGKYKKAKEDRTVEATPAPAAADESKFVTKDDQFKINQKRAISLATTVDEKDKPEVAKIKKDLDENWDEIKAFYTGRNGKDTPEDIVEDLFDAHAVWLRRTGGKKGADEKNARANITNDRGTGGRTPDNSTSKRTRVLPKDTKPQDWYPKKS